MSPEGFTATRHTAHPSTTNPAPQPVDQIRAKTDPPQPPPPQPDFAKALEIAWKALIKDFAPIKIRLTWEEFDFKRVCLSADVTAYCRDLELLTVNQFIVYRGNYLLDYEKPQFRPVLFEDSDGEIKKLGQLPLGEVDTIGDLFDLIPQHEVLRAEFRELSKHLKHPLHEKPPPQFPPNWKSPI